VSAAVEAAGLWCCSIWCV